MSRPLERVFAAIEYIESQLAEELQLDAIAFRSTYSRFHFQRLFHACVGFPVFDYIRRRRLSEAARRLLETESRRETKIIDVAFASGFASHAAFTRSFRDHFGVSPDAFRRHGGAAGYAMLPACTYEQLQHFQRLLTDSAQMEYVLRHEAELRLACAPAVGPDLQAILRAWGEFLKSESGRAERAPRYAGLIEYAPVQGVAVDFRYSPARIMDSAAVESPGDQKEPGGEGLRPREIPAGELLICTHRGPVRELPRTFFYIYGPLLSKLQRSVRADVECDLEVYDPRGFRSPDDPDNRIEIWVPLAPEPEAAPRTERTEKGASRRK